MSAFQSLVFDYRNVLSGLPLVYAAFSTRWAWQSDVGIWTVGLMLAVLGVAVRGWAVFHCNYAQGRKKALATTGPYAFMRNPLYIGNALIIAAATVASGLPWLLLISVPWAFAVYSVSIRHEETRVLDRYGDEFVSYAARVPRWIPTAESLYAGLRSPALLALLRQSACALVLLPFVLKHMNAFGLWP